MLGTGSFGTVCSCLWRGRPVAVKTLHRNRMREGELRGVKRCAELQLELPPHPNLVQLLGVGTYAGLDPTASVSTDHL